MKKILPTILFLVGCAFLLGCKTTSSAETLRRFEFSEAHMGTLFSITLYARAQAVADAGSQAAFARIAALDHMMTDYDPKSELMQLCLHPVGQPRHVSPELFELVAESIRVTHETGGAFDITVGPFVRTWRAARKSGVLPTPEQIAEMRKSIGVDKLRLDAREHTITLLAPNMRLDLGGIAKGYAADAALRELRRLGILSALVAASGDIAIGDPPPGKRGWTVGIAALDGLPNELARTVTLHNAGVSTSGDTAQHLEINGVRYSHIIDPATGLGLTNHIQVTIIGPNATITDGLDTPLDIMGAERAIAFVNARPKLATLIVSTDASGKHVITSRRFQERFGAK